MGMISTNGWDTVFALRLPAINRAIAAAAKKGEIKIPPIDFKSDGLEMTGKFGVWQLTSEGLQNTGGHRGQHALPRIRCHADLGRPTL